MDCWLNPGINFQKVFKVNGWDYDSCESKDELYNDSPGTFLSEIFMSIESKKNVFVVKLYDKTINELSLIWNFSHIVENWEFGFKWLTLSAKEILKMKHVVKMVAYIDTEETDLVELGKLGLEKIKKEIESGVCVVDVYKNCVSIEMVCVNINDKKEEVQGGKKGKD